MRLLVCSPGDEETMALLRAVCLWSIRSSNAAYPRLYHHQGRGPFAQRRFFEIELPNVFETGSVVLSADRTQMAQEDIFPSFESLHKHSVI